MDTNNLTPEELDSLPIGAVVLDSGHRFVSDRCAWQKSGDTDLRDEYDERRPAAWGSIQWVADRTSEELVAKHGPIRLLWAGGE